MGWPHPDYLLEALDVEQIAGWQDYYSREPFGFPAQDLLNGFSAYIAARIGGSKEVEVSQFMLGEALAEGPALEDGGPSDDALAVKLEKLLPVRQVLGPDGVPVK